MPDAFNWTTVWTALVTSVLVTLVVEYVAKPRLEIRRDRILEVERDQRELAAITLDLLLLLLLLAAAASEPIPTEADAVARSRIAAEQARRRERLVERAQYVADNMHRFALIRRPMISRFVLPYLIAVQGAVLMSSWSEQEQAETVVRWSKPMAVVLDPSLRHLYAWVRAVAEVTALVDERNNTSEEIPLGEPPSAGCA